LRNRRISSLIVIPLLLASESTPAEIYQWKDEKGTLHFTEDESAIPERFRDQAQKRQVTDEAKSPMDKPKIKTQDIKGKKGEAPKKPTVNLGKIESDAEESFKAIISLWKDGKFDALYECGDRKSRTAVSKEDFERGMANKQSGLAPSWETVKDIKVDIQSAVRVYTTAKLGFKSKKGGDTKFRTETYPMTYESGLWKIDLLKILRAKI